VTEQAAEPAGHSPSGAASTWARTRNSFGEGTWSLRRRLAIAFAVAAITLIVGCAVGGLALASMISAVDLQVNRLDPAAHATSDLLTSALDAETGVRGYILTGHASSLVPYNQGRMSSDADIRQLHGLIDSYPKLRADLRTVQNQASLWRSAYADPAIAATKAHHTLRSGLQAAGTNDFNALRNDIAALNDAILTERQVALHRLHSATSLVLIVAVTGAVALVGGAGAAWLGLHSWVIRPLAALGDEAQAVASGSIDHRLKVSGPREVMQLAADVETMRRQLLRSLDDVSFKAGELERSNRELEQFAYVASHDLQEPLRKVASFCQMLESRYGAQLDERGHQYIAYAVDGAVRMQGLINELLKFSRVGQPGTVRGPVDLNVAAREAVDALDAILEDTDAQIIIGDLPTVNGDQTLLTQLFQNLIANSIKFRRVDEHPIVQIAATRKDSQWEFSCEDNGIGIAPAYAERVFVIFQRLHPREAYPGTGIGLALCRKIVDFHGGQIWVEPTNDGGPGTTIRWTMPVTDGY
jgi:signal transduction histidine kinase